MVVTQMYRCANTSLNIWPLPSFMTILSVFLKSLKNFTRCHYKWKTALSCHSYWSSAPMHESIKCTQSVGHNLSLCQVLCEQFILWLDQQMDRWMDIWTNGQMDEHMDKSYSVCPLLFHQKGNDLIRVLLKGLCLFQSLSYGCIQKETGKDMTI